MSRFKRTQGPVLVLFGGCLLLGSACTTVCLNCPQANIALGVLGVALMTIGVGINYWIVRSRVAKRGQFE